MFFTEEGLQQASSEVMGSHISARLGGARRIADVCCGIGGDLVSLVRGRDITAIDVSHLHMRIALANARVYEPDACVRGVVSKAEDLRYGAFDVVYIDPARRIHGQRLMEGKSEPPLRWCLGLSTQTAVAVKHAPGLAHSAVPPDWEIEFVAEGRALKMSLLWSPALARARTRATILPKGDYLDSNSPSGSHPVPVREPGIYLLDPNPAVTRAHLVENLAAQLGAWKIDEEIGFLSLDHPARTPFARLLRVEASLPWHERRVREVLTAAGMGAVDIRRRGLAGDVDLIRRRLRLRGEHRGVLVMTRVRNRPWALLCTEPAEEAS